MSSPSYRRLKPVVFAGDVFSRVSGTTQDILLDTSSDYLIDDSLQIGSTSSLELPATSTAEVTAYPNQAEVQSYMGYYDFVESGCVWTGDAYASTPNGSMTAGFVWIRGRRLAVAKVTAKVFTLSRDTYIDLEDNNNGTARVIYNETTNNATTGSPPLSPGRIRIAIIVTDAGDIQAAASINQGEVDKVVPIVSSIPYAVTDSLGNLICPRDPFRKLLGYRQILTNATTTGGPTDVTGLNLTCIIPTGRRFKVSGFIGNGSASVANNGISMQLHDVTAAAQIASGHSSTNASADSDNCAPSAIRNDAGTRNYKAQITKGTNAATANSNGTATNPNYLMVELI